VNFLEGLGFVDMAESDQNLVIFWIAIVSRNFYKGFLHFYRSGIGGNCTNFADGIVSFEFL